MKVCTDSSLFGALIESENANTILDIGSGTGVLSLMQAQKSNASIIALEIDSKAANQAQFNVEQSEWKDKIKVIHTDVKNYESNVLFDLILSNPPFFKQNLKSKNQSVNLARHDDGLSLEELFDVVCKLLQVKGVFWLLLPEYEFSVFQTIAENKLFCYKKYAITNVKGKNKFRNIGAFSFEKKELKEIEVVIKTSKNEYTSQFKELLKDYYLAF